MNVPFLDLQAQYQAIKHHIDEGIRGVLETSSYIQGPAVERFEAEFADYIGAKHVIGVANGTDALYLALRAAGIGVGDEVITAANTFIATAEAISAVGAQPVLVDMDPSTSTLDPGKIEAGLTDRTRAILPVHLYGRAADMASIMAIAERRGLVVIEDACQAHGAILDGHRLGTIGDIGCFSCYPGKNLGAYGDAGILVTNDDELARRVRLLGNHGSARKYVHEVIGWNSRLDSLQAAVLSAKLPHLDEWNEQRRGHAAFYLNEMSELPIGLPTPAGEEHVWHLFVVEVDDRDAFVSHLSEHGIATGIHYPVPLHLTQAYGDLPYAPGDFPAAELAAGRIVSLPMFPEMTAAQRQTVVDVVRSYFADRNVA